MTTVLTLMKVELFDWKPELLCFPLSLGCKTLNNILFSLQSANMKNLDYFCLHNSNNDQPSGVCLHALLYMESYSHKSDLEASQFSESKCERQD